MKKLIGLLSSFSLVFSSSAAIVSCKKVKATTPGENPNPSPDDTNLSEVEQSNLELFFRNGYDGAIFNTKTTAQEALNIISLEIKNNISEKITYIKFVDPNEANQYLIKGSDNTIAISYKVGDKDFINSLLITNVKDADKLTNANEVKDFVNLILDNSQLLTTGYGNEDLNASLEIKWTNFISKRVKVKLSDAEVFVRSVKGKNASELDVTIEINKLPFGVQKMSKQITYVIPTPPPPKGSGFDDILENIGKNELQVTSEFYFTTNNYKSAAIGHIINHIKKSLTDKKVNFEKVEFVGTDSNNNLSEGKNEFKFKISKDKSTSKEITVFLNGVEKLLIDESLVNFIDKEVKNRITETPLFEGTTYLKAVNEINLWIRPFHNNIDITLNNLEQESEKLVIGKNTIEVLIKNSINKPVIKEIEIDAISKVSVEKNYQVLHLHQKKVNSIHTFQNIVDIFKWDKKNNPKQNWTLKDDSKKNEKLNVGENLVELILVPSSGKEKNMIVKIFLFPFSSTYVESTSDTFKEVYKYQTNGIEASEFEGQLYADEYVVDAVAAFKRFLLVKDESLFIKFAGEKKEQEFKLNTGDNKIEMVAMKGKERSKFTITIKNVNPKKITQ